MSDIYTVYKQIRKYDYSQAYIIQTNTYSFIYLFRPYLFIISRAHRFPRAAELRAEPLNLGYCRGIEPRNLLRNSSFSRRGAEFDVFHSNNYFFTENDLKVALLQLCL